MRSPVAAIAELESACRDLSDQDILAPQPGASRPGSCGRTAGALRTSLFALAREASRRVLGQRPFDEQIVAALALDDGHVVEMQTGEGKTLAAVMPAALNAFTDRGVHVLTFNDYLARRDAEWMGPVYRMLGLSVGHIQQGMPPAARRAAYDADITYVTAKEAGFDHLRDLLAMDAADLVHRPFHFALVDEADSLMIDEARVPLVIAGSVERDASLAPRLAALVASLSPGVHFDTDEYGRDIELTEAGIEHVERVLGCGSLHGTENLALLTELNCALHARVLLRRDVDYIVRDGRIEIVDEFTGRVVADRHWPDGLQAALEAKEGLERRPDGRILGSMTLQRFLRGYPRLCGMTGTARDAAPRTAAALRARRRRHSDAPADGARRSGRPRVHAPRREGSRDRRRDSARACHRTPGAGRHVHRDGVGAPGRPASQRGRPLRGAEREERRRRSCHRRARRRVRRGHDLHQHGRPRHRHPPRWRGRRNEADRDRVAALGGLYVIGTNRHESRRVDLQLRGRAGRQGDPGESRFFVSLEDDLLVRYGIHDLIPARFFPRSPTRRSTARSSGVKSRARSASSRVRTSRFAGRSRATPPLSRSSIASSIERRRAILRGDDPPGRLGARARTPRALVAAAGEQAVLDAERAVTLGCIDRAWRDHLALCADLREGIHLVRLGGQDPLTRVHERSDPGVLADR